MRADLYTLALISALPEDHVFLSQFPKPGVFNVDDSEYGIYPRFSENVPVYDWPAADVEGVVAEQAIDEVASNASSALQSGAGMIVVHLDLITLLREELDPPPPEPPQYKTLFDPRDFMRLFPKDVEDAIYTLAMTNIDVRKFIDKTLAGNVWTKHPEFIEGVDLLLGLGAINQELHDSLLQGQRLN